MRGQGRAAGRPRRGVRWGALLAVAWLVAAWWAAPAAADEAPATAGAPLAAAGVPATAAGARASAAEDDGCDPQEMICIDVFEDDPDAITARWEGSERVWIVEPPTGYVRIRHKGDTVTARRLRLKEDEDYARLEEDVVLEREDMRSRSHALDLWWEQEEYIFTGDVVIVQYEEAPADGEREGEGADGAGGGAAGAEGQRKEIRTVSAQRVEYRAAEGEVVATGDAHMVDDQYRVWAQQMVYQEEPETMRFTGQVRVEATEDQWVMMGEHFYYDVDAEEGHLVGPHRMIVTPRD